MKLATANGLPMRLARSLPDSKHPAPLDAGKNLIAVVSRA